MVYSLWFTFLADNAFFLSENCEACHEINLQYNSSILYIKLIEI